MAGGKGPRYRRWRVLGSIAATLAVAASCGGGGGGTLEQACLSGPRQTAEQRALCACIQSAANRSLSDSDQRRAAGFFADPQRAQDARQSSRPRDREFWERYRTFVTTAEDMCLPQNPDS